MKKVVLVLSIAAIIIGVGMPSCSITKPVKTQPNPQLETLKKEKKELKQQYDEATAKLDTLNKMMYTGKYPLEIDAMLNIEDSTIFTCSFKQYDMLSVHPRSRDMYQWVSSIHELGELLQLIEIDNSSIDILNADLSNLPQTTIKRLESLNANIKGNIRSAEKLEEQIEEQYYSDMKRIFSLSQMNYYNGLVDKLKKYNGLYFK